MTERQESLVKELDQTFRTQSLEEFVATGSRRDLETLFEVLYQCKLPSIYRTKLDIAKQLRNFVHTQLRAEAFKHIVV